MYEKSPIWFIMKSDQTYIRKTHMEHLKNTTDLIGLKDKNIKILFVWQLQTHIEIKAKLDYQAPACPHCQANMIFRKLHPFLSLTVKECLLSLSSRNDVFSARLVVESLCPRHLSFRKIVRLPRLSGLKSRNYTPKSWPTRLSLKDCTFLFLSFNDN